MALDRSRKKRKLEGISNKSILDNEIERYSLNQLNKLLDELTNKIKGEENKIEEVKSNRSNSDIDIIKKEETKENNIDLFGNSNNKTNNSDYNLIITETKKNIKEMTNKIEEISSNIDSIKKPSINQEEEKNKLISSINNKIAMLDSKLNILYNNEEIINNAKVIKEKIVKIGDLNKKSLDELKLIDERLNKLIKEYAKLETKAEEIKDRDDFIIKNNSILMNEYKEFSTKMKEKYGDNFVIMLNEDEEKRFIDLRSKALNKSKASVIEEVENAFSIAYDQKIKNLESKNEEDVEVLDTNEGENKEELNDEIESIKKEIELLDEQIKSLLDYFTPYRSQIPKVNDEMTKVEEKLNEINTSQIIDSLTDYIRIKDVKTNIIDYLQKAQNFIIEKTSDNQSL